MLHELRNFEIAREIFKSPTIHLALERILAGKTVSPIYVDDIKNPKVAITWENKRVFIYGDPENQTFRKDINMILDQQYFVAYLRGPTFVAYPDRGEWTKVLKEIFYDAKAEIGFREYYGFNLDDKKWESEPVNDYEFVEVSKQFIMKPLENMELLLEEMRSETDSPDDFLNREHFGIVALKRKKVAGFCLSEYNFQDKFEVGIEVLPNHQKQGLATEMTKKLVKLAASKGYKHLGWHCWSKNKASIATAQKIGLKKITEYPACSLTFT
ncbi:GNAT family N-acetyltransferase [Candidatus Bathyarchaeota archaeon]|nr:GNAT family N-acetyltransferase [Candidatus Bathyarchaeota archaeon]